MSLFMFDAMSMIRAGVLPSLLRLMIPNLPKLPQFSRVTAEIERQYGVKSPGFAQFLNTTGTITISYTSKLLQPGNEKMPDSIKFVGPSVQPRTDQSDFPFDQLTGQALIYISLGTVINQNQEFYQRCFQAFGDSGCQVVMSVGKKMDIASLGELPENFIVRNFVPQLEILQRAALFITHSGMNSVHEGLYYNVPLLLVPQQVEQRYVASRIQELGAGLMLSSATPSVHELQTSARGIMDDTQFKRQATVAGDSLRQAGGHQRAADEILLLIRAGLYKEKPG
jgi:MGT family glycosyltransferase